MWDCFTCDIVAWDGRTILLLDTETKTLTTVRLRDADNLTELLGRKRKRVWVKVEDGMLTDVQWVRKSGRYVTLRYFPQAGRWFNYI